MAYYIKGAIGIICMEVSMSRIVTFLKCDHCEKEYDTYISFGHPNEDFVWSWQCKECSGVNDYLVKALPRWWWLK